MDILENNLEELLKKILEEYKGEPLMINGSFCEKHEIKELFDKGYVCGSVFDKMMWIYTIEPTQKGKYYFENKEKFLMQKRKAERKESRRYWITTSIAICALIIAIIALFV